MKRVQKVKNKWEGHLALCPWGFKVNMFVDSGAFTAWRKGVQLDINEYIDFLHKYKDAVEVYCNLDVIPEQTGDTDSYKNRIAAAEATWKNQEKIEAAGLTPLPVYHIGEPDEFLHRCVRDYEFFAIGGMARADREKRRSALDWCFSVICDTSDGQPKRRVHGLGMTSLLHMWRYPFYSFDSTSWLVARNGVITVPQIKDGERVYYKYPNESGPLNLNVSNKSALTSGNRATFSGYHLETISPKERESMMKYITECGHVLGTSTTKQVQDTTIYELAENERWWRKGEGVVEIIEEEGIANNYHLRDHMNVIFFLELMKRMPLWPRPFEEHIDKKGGLGLLDTRGREPYKVKYGPPQLMKLYFAGTSPGKIGERAQPLPFGSRLMSYYHIKTDDLEAGQIFELCVQANREAIKEEKKHGKKTPNTTGSKKRHVANG